MPRRAHAEHQGGVFDRVVVVDFEVAFGGHLQVEDAVVGEGREQVVEEADTGCHDGFTGAVQLQAHLDPGFTGGPFDASKTTHGNLLCRADSNRSWARVVRTVKRR